MSWPDVATSPCAASSRSTLSSPVSIGAAEPRPLCGSLDHQRSDPIRQTERCEPPRKVGTAELAANNGVEHVSRQTALRVTRHPRAQELERDDRDGLMQGQTIEVRQRTAVLDRHQPRLRHPHGTRRTCLRRAVGRHRQREPLVSVVHQRHERPGLATTGPVADLALKRRHRGRLDRAPERALHDRLAA